MSILANHDLTITEGLRSSGASPPTVKRPKTIHLLGAGKVGREFLLQLSATPHRLIAVTDSTATVFSKEGLSPRAIVEYKEKGLLLLQYPGAEALPEWITLQFVHADVVADATPTDLTNPQHAAGRARNALASGSAVALAAKDALFADAAFLAAEAARGRAGIRAALGGAGAAIAAEIVTLQKETVEIAITANATTSTILDALALGNDYLQSLDAARARGLLESDPEQDLGGSDAAVKLAIIAKLIFNIPVAIPQIPREHIRSVHADRIAEARAAVRTLRLVGRATRDGKLSVCYESLDRGAPLVAPPDRLIYQFRLRDGSTRVITGFGVGPAATAAALLADIDSFNFTKGGVR